jgi:F-type H+-transporting ATPase subunit b
MSERFLVGLATLVTAATPALAAAEGHGAISPFAGDLGNALWTLVIFLCVVAVLGKFAWGPLLKSLQTREAFIRESLEKAKRDRDEAEARLKEYHEKLAAAHVQATAIVEEGRRDAEAVKRRIEEETKKSGDQMIERARHEIELATQNATRELYSLSARLATDMAARILGREVSAQDHERLIAESIDDLGAARPS